MVKKYSRILVPFDGSKYSERALNEAIEIAKNFGSKLYVIMAVSTPIIEPPGMYFGYIRGVDMDKAFEDYTNIAYERAERILQDILERCRKKGVEASYRVISDKPGKAVLDFSKRNYIDLIVMGSQGLRGIKKIKVLGSVSRHVLENATCPILIVH
ncbi:MAG: universal stress protein [Thaumarchaeota archaeon]|nr:universal stress protein [Nitrososphaerota archaeon]